MTDRLVRLGDERRVGVIEHGDPHGTPVLLFHGTPSSRLGHEFADAPAKERDVRIICPDRPGIGQSDPAPDRTVASYADDVAALLDVLELDRATVIGYSCGGPYALAAGAGRPDRVTAAALMAGAGPLDRPGARDGLSKGDRQLLRLAETRPWAAAMVLRAMKVGARVSPKTAVKSFAKELGESDRAALAEEGVDMAFFVDALRQGPQGVIDEYLLWAKPWGFALEDVTIPVHIFQGDDDLLVPMHHAEDMAARLPKATLHVLAGVGHVSIQSHVGEMLDALLATS